MANALLWVALSALLSQNLLIPVAATATASFHDQKTYYTPDPHAHTPPTVSYSPPPHSSGGGHATPTPFHGTPPSHGGGGHGGSPPTNCGIPPSSPHHHHHTPSPSPPSGGYYNPPTPTPTTPTPTTPTPTTPTPTTPTYTPTPPTTITPPTTPIDPGTPNPPSITFPSPPFPISPPFTCIYWRNHPTLIWGLFGWFGTVGGALGVPSSAPGLGSNMNLLEALSNTRTDGFGELYREGTAALLNSMHMSHGGRFPYTTNQVQNSFVAALRSDKAATAQARLFKLANEGKIRA